MPDPAKIRVIIVDDHPVVRFGLAAIIGLQPDMKVEFLDSYKKAPALSIG